MTIRLKRLQADYQKIIDTFSPDGKIRIKQNIGNPPEKYQLEYLVNSLVMRPDGSIQTKNSHLVEIFLTRSYPRQAPQCRMLTPVFHPNIAPHAICIGDHWAAGESLTHLITRIGEMLAFQSYNLKSPLNGDAAKWVEANKAKLPIDKYDFSTLFEAGEKTMTESGLHAKESSDLLACANCGSQVKRDEISLCASKHAVCSNCMIKCAICGLDICLKCLTGKCSICGRLVCVKCFYKCSGCKKGICKDHSSTCHVCNQKSCPDCGVDCQVCGKSACLDHIKSTAGVCKCSKCQEKV
ncbi:MAG: hypothetical protein HQM08_24165 [Candidatus Riflebacteria bacterium]|nr:hypothetical protein [Candidatus Riflebacteria bacterium]